MSSMASTAPHARWVPPIRKTMQTSLTYTPSEWIALAALLNRPNAPILTDSGLRTRINNAIGRSWLAGLSAATVEMEKSDAAILRALRSGLPDAEVLAALIEAERIIREHQRRRAPR
jgi:hypothetical protein